MSFQADTEIIQWKIHFHSSIDKVFQFLSKDEGRNKFWAATQSENDNVRFTFPNSYVWEGKILESNAPRQISFLYIDNSIVTFTLNSDGKTGTDLYLEDRGVNPNNRIEVIAGWGSILMALKAAVDFDVDLRNHDATRTWDNGYFDN